MEPLWLLGISFILDKVNRCPCCKGNLASTRDTISFSLVGWFGWLGFVVKFDMAAEMFLASSKGELESMVCTPRRDLCQDAICWV